MYVDNREPPTAYASSNVEYVQKYGYDCNILIYQCYITQQRSTLSMRITLTRIINERT